MTKRELAQTYFFDGYNCCQAVLLAFTEELGLTREQAARMGSSFGGGVSRLREICGAVSGMAMTLGLHCGYESPTDMEAKSAHYNRVRLMAARFKKENGSYVCRDLLNAHPEPLPAPGEAKPVHNPACGKFVGDAAAMLEELFEQERKREC